MKYLLITGFILLLQPSFLFADTVSYPQEEEAYINNEDRYPIDSEVSGYYDEYETEMQEGTYIEGYEGEEWPMQEEEYEESI